MRTFAGSGKNERKDGAPLHAAFQSPAGLSFGPGGVLFVADNRGHAIRCALHWQSMCGQICTVGRVGVLLVCAFLWLGVPFFGSVYSIKVPLKTQTKKISDVESRLI